MAEQRKGNKVQISIPLLTATVPCDRVKIYFDEKEVSYGLQNESPVRRSKEDSGEEDDSEEEKIRRSWLENAKKEG